MPTTYSQDHQFIKDVLPTDLLQSAIDWITQNMRIEEVYDEKIIKEWAEDNDYVHEKDLDTWALSNGYVKE